MKIFRMLVEIGTGVWTYVIAAPDHVEAWRLLLETLSPQERSLAELAELEAGESSTRLQAPMLLQHYLCAGRAFGAA